MDSPEKRLYDFTTDDLENSNLSALAREAGYASLRSLCNDQNRWTETAEQVENFLTEQIKEMKEENARKQLMRHP